MKKRRRKAHFDILMRKAYRKGRELGFKRIYKRRFYWPRVERMKMLKRKKQGMLRFKKERGKMTDELMAAIKLISDTCAKYDNGLECPNCPLSFIREGENVYSCVYETFRPAFVKAIVD